MNKPTFTATASTTPGITFSGFLISRPNESAIRDNVAFFAAHDKNIPAGINVEIIDWPRSASIIDFAGAIVKAAKASA